MTAKQKPDSKNNHEKEWPVVVHAWMIGLFFITLLVARMVLDSFPHRYHWLSIPIGLLGLFLGMPIGWLWFRWRGDII